MTIKRLSGLVLVCTMLICLWASVASATTIIDYSFYAGFPAGSDGSFSFSSPSFITSYSQNIFSVHDWTGSTTYANLTTHPNITPPSEGVGEYYYSWKFINFLSTGISDIVSISVEEGYHIFSYPSPGLLFVDSDDWGFGGGYSFEKGAFSTVGHYTSTNFVDGFGPGYLDVSSHEVVPEPSTMLLLGAGLTGLAFWRKRKSVK